MKIINREPVKKYFTEKRTTLALALIIIGIITVAWIIGFFLIIFGCYLLYKAKNNFENEDKVDEITQMEVNEAKERAIKKFNLIQDQVSLIEPISIYGPANQPNSPTSAVLAMGGKRFSKAFKKQLSLNNDDPIFVEKLGSDSRYRYTLLDITTYLFGEDQLYIYSSHVDITTGLVFEEDTFEYFYKDIETMLSKQVSTRIFNVKKKKFERIVKEWFEIRTSGSYHTGAFGARKPEDPSKIDEQFTAMKNLIREKKNA